MRTGPFGCKGGGPIHALVRHRRKSHDRRKSKLDPPDALDAPLSVHTLVYVYGTGIVSVWIALQPRLVAIWGQPVVSIGGRRANLGLA